jgi:RHS repeat-associated protein
VGATYTYDAENRITKVVNGNGTTSYVYDANGRRVEKITSSAQTHYFYDEDGNVVMELNQSGAVVKDYIYMGGQHIAEIYNGRTYLIHTDHLGSTRTATDYAGNVPDFMDYMPFGEQIAGGSFTTHKFTGYERDFESSLDDAQARYNASSAGRLLSPDPGNVSGLISQDDPQSWNGYAYVRNNPLTLTDPSGTNYTVCTYSSWGDAQNCADLSDNQYDQFRQNSPDVTSTASGNLYAGDTLIGSAAYYNEKIGLQLQQAGSMSQAGLNWSMLLTSPNFAVVGVAHLFLGGALTTLGLSPTAISATGPLAYAASQLSKPSALQQLQTIGGTPQQIEVAKSFIQRATATSEISIEKFSDGVLRVTIDRAGVDGSMSMVRIINTSGMSNLYQRAVNAAGELVHLDPKNP